MTLPSEIIADLALPFRTRGRAFLADGSMIEYDIRQAFISWNGALRSILVDVSDTDPLLGMKLLYGHNLNIDVVDGGTITIRPLGP